MNEGYAPQAVPGLPLVPARVRRSLGFGILGDDGSEVEEAGGIFPGGDRNWAAGPRGGLGDNGWDTPPRRMRRASEDVKRMWGKFLVLSVDIPQGLCPGGSGSGCSRVWMYGSEAWGALRARCRDGLAAAEAGAGAGAAARRMHQRGQGDDYHPVEVACAVGDVAGRKGGEWGLEARHVCGAGPQSAFSGDGGGKGGGEAGGAKWERARVWEVYPPGDS